MSRTRKVSVILTTLIIAAFEVVVANAPQGYHFSIFDHFSSVSLAAALFILFVTSFLVIRFRYRGLYAVAPVIVLPILTLLLPEMLGYAFDFGDITTHLRDASYIIETGNLGSVTTGPAAYPLLHLLWTVTALLTGFPVDNVIVPLAIVAFVTYSITCGLIARNYGRIPLYAAVLATFSIFKLAAPAGYAYALVLPLLVYVLTKPRLFALQRVSLVGFLLVALWVGHPLPALAFTGLIFLYILVRFVGNRLPSTNSPFELLRTVSMEDIAVNWRILSLSVSIGIVWFMYFTRWLRLGVFYGYQSFVSVFGPDTGSESEVAVDQATESLFGLLDLGLFDTAWIAIQLYGEIWLLLLFSFIWVVVSYRCWRRTLTRRFRVFILLFVFVPPVLSVVQFVTGLIPVVSYGRMLRTTIYIAPALAGIALADGIRHLRTNYSARNTSIIAITLTVLLVSGMVFGLLGLYGTPGIYQRNSHVAPSEATGWQWYFDNKKQGVITVSPGTGPDRYAQRFLTPERLNGNKAVQWKEGRVCRPPRHFADQTDLGILFEGSYYVEPVRDRLWNIRMYEDFGRYSEADFESLKTDPTINQVYQNGGFRVSTIGSDTNRMIYPDTCVKTWQYN